ncbi:MAG TPA: restriction endonuclease subunit S [Rugosibacter sp.]
MNNKAKTTTPKPDGKPALTPKLRFPEFRDSAGWEIKPFAKLFSIGNGRDHKHLAPGDVPVYGSGGYMRSVDEYLYDGESVCIGRKGTINNPMFLTGKFWTVDTLFYTHSFNQCLPKFIFSIFQSIDWLKHNEAGGVPSLSKTNIEKIETAVPSLPEQQKIAECLSSMDELMATQARKLNALKTHKKWLMQQLFPREGETQPRLRFPEFRNTRAWVKENLTDIAKTSIGLVTTMTTSYANEGVPLIRNSDIQQNKVRKEKLIFLLESFADKYPSKKLKEGDIVTVHTGDIGVSAVIDSELSGCLGFATLNTRLLKHGVLPEYICWYFNSDTYICFALSMATGDGRNNFNLSDFNRSVIPIPSQAEQQKIVDCLSFLDDLITAQTQKLDALKTHKKGLMQQLFPSPEEVEA